MRLRQWKIDFFHLILSVWSERVHGCMLLLAASTLLHIINELEIHINPTTASPNRTKKRRITVERALMAYPKCDNRKNTYSIITFIYATPHHHHYHYYSSCCAMLASLHRCHCCLFYSMRICDTLHSIYVYEHF